MIKPRGVTAEMALRMPPSIELDVFIFENVVGGPEDIKDMSKGRIIPSFSRKFADMHPLLIKLMAEHGDMHVGWGKQYYDAAHGGRFVRDGDPIPVWAIKVGEHDAYGRSFQEAVCKMTILKMLEDQKSV